VHLNPGPNYHFPSSVCKKPVNSSQPALLCDGCSSSCHTTCAGVNNLLYKEFQIKTNEFRGSALLVCLQFCKFDPNELNMTQDSIKLSCNTLPSTIDALASSFNGIRIVSHNIQGIHSKLTEIYQWTNDSINKNVIFCLTEIWISPQSPPVNIQGFHTFLSPIHHRTKSAAKSVKSKYYPGSCLLISESLSIERHSLCIDIENSCQLLDVTCCVILCKHFRLAVVSISRSPSTDVKSCLAELNNVFMQLLSLTKYVVVVGDLNIDLLKNTAIQKNYKDLLSDFQFVQYNSEPSRVTRTSATLIDHVLCTPVSSVKKCYQAIGLSDHRTQILELTIPSIKSIVNPVITRSFCNCDWDELRKALITAPWQVMEIYDNINDMWHFFCSILQNCLHVYAPLRLSSKKSRRPTPWMTPSLLIAIKDKKRAKRKVEISHNSNDIVVY